MLQQNISIGIEINNQFYKLNSLPVDPNVELDGMKLN